MLSSVFAQIVTQDKPNEFQDLEKVFTSVLTAAIPLAGIVLFIILLLAGFNYVSAGSDPKKVEMARQTITWAIVGIVIIASSYLILQFVANFTGVRGILNFQVFIP